MGTSTYMKAATHISFIVHLNGQTHQVKLPHCCPSGLHTCEERPPVMVKGTALHHQRCQCACWNRCLGSGLSQSSIKHHTRICNVTPKEKVNASRARLCAEPAVS